MGMAFWGSKKNKLNDGYWIFVLLSFLFNHVLVFHINHFKPNMALSAIAGTFIAVVGEVSHH